MPSLTAVHVTVISLAAVIRCFSFLALKAEAQEASSGTGMVSDVFRCYHEIKNGWGQYKVVIEWLLARTKAGALALCHHGCLLSYGSAKTTLPCHLE